MQHSVVLNEYQAFVIKELEGDRTITIHYCTAGFNKGDPKKRVVVPVPYIVNRDRGMAYCVLPQSWLINKPVTAPPEQQAKGLAKLMLDALNKECPSDSNAEPYFRVSFRKDRSISMVFAMRSESEYENLGQILDRAGCIRENGFPTPKVA